MKARIIIPWRATPDRAQNFRFCHRWWSRHFPEIPIELADTGHYQFNRGATRNDGVVKAYADRCDVVVVADADTVPEELPVREALFAARDGKLHLPYTTFHGLTQLGTRRAIAGRPLSEQPTSDAHDHATGGILVIKPEAYLDAGGMPELIGWGFEDTIFRITADAILGPTVKHTGTIYHLHHNTVWNLGGPEWTRNKEICDEYVACEGDPLRIKELISRRDGNDVPRNTTEG